MLVLYLFYSGILISEKDQSFIIWLGSTLKRNFKISYFCYLLRTRANNQAKASAPPNPPDGDPADAPQDQEYLDT